MIKWFLGLSVHTLPALLLAIGERFVFTDSEFHNNYVNLGLKLRDELQVCTLFHYIYILYFFLF